LAKMTFKTPFALDDLVRFILRAREQSYVGGAEKIKNPQRPGFKEFAPFREGLFEYVDSYIGYYYAPGQEIVRFKDVPVWNMAYNGGIAPEFHGDLEFARRINAFLRKALLNVKQERPFRGPSLLVQDDFVYVDRSRGDITHFNGTERIFYRDDNVFKRVFKQDYIGGLIAPK